MECNQLPTRWDQSSPRQIHLYRDHLRFCASCRQRVLRESPDQLLFQMDESELPNDFWIGFWDSLHTKIDGQGRPPLRNFSSVFVRWAAVAACAAILLLYGRSLHDVPVAPADKGSPFIHASTTTGYPLIEDVKSPGVTCYILQTSEDEKIVMMFDPDMEL